MALKPLFSRLWRGSPASGAHRPRAAVQQGGGGVLITSPEQLEEALRSGNVSEAGVAVTPETAMRSGVVYACVRIRGGVIANLPLHIKRRVSDRERADASDTAAWSLLRRKPNAWQTPSQFKRMMESHVLLRGFASALKVPGIRGTQALIPLHPDRVTYKQQDDHSLVFTYTRRNGVRVTFPQDDIFHLVGLTLDGVHGVTPITYARESIGLALAQEQHGAKAFRNSLRTASVLVHPGQLGAEGQEHLRATLDEYREGGEREGRSLILEEGMTVAPLGMTAQDAQWVESRQLTRTDIGMYFGIPPFLLGDTAKSTSWGTGLEQQVNGAVTFTFEDDFTMWEEAINRDLLGNDPDLYARFNRAAMVRGDIKTRHAAYVQSLQWGWLSPNEVRALEDLNPREGGDVYYDPPNTAGGNASGEADDEAAGGGRRGEEDEE